MTFRKTIIPPAVLFGLTTIAWAQQFSPWSPAVNLGAVVNSSANEGCPFIAKSDLTLYVVSTRGDGFGGQDIYVSHRDSIYDAWGPLQNVGPGVNSAGNEMCPTLTIDGESVPLGPDGAYEHSLVGRGRIIVHASPPLSELDFERPPSGDATAFVLLSGRGDYTVPDLIVACEP